jgi:hypothetical protein
MIEAVVKETMAFSYSLLAKNSLPCSTKIVSCCSSRSQGRRDPMEREANERSGRKGKRKGGERRVKARMKTHPLLLLLRQVPTERRPLRSRLRAQLQQPPPTLQRPPLNRSLLRPFQQLHSRPKLNHDPLAVLRAESEGSLEGSNAALPLEEGGDVFGEEEGVGENEAVHCGVEGV